MNLKNNFTSIIFFSIFEIWNFGNALEVDQKWRFKL